MPSAVSSGRWLILDASSGASGAQGALARICLLDATGKVLASRERIGPGGAPHLAADVPRLFGCDRTGLPQELIGLGGVACVVGPGSFTGLRATLALAQGLHAGGAPEPVAVTVGEAFGIDLQPGLWVATMARKGRAFVESAGSAAFGVDLAEPGGFDRHGPPSSLAGDGAAILAPYLGLGDAVTVVARGPSANGIFAAALRRISGALPPRAVLPFYVDPPEAKLPSRAVVGPSVPTRT